MTPKQLVSIYQSLNELSNVVLPYQKTREMVRLRRRVQDEIDTILTMEQTLAAKYGGTQGKDKTYHFPDVEKTKQFAQEHTQFYEHEEVIELPTVDLSQYTGFIRLSPAAMEALDGVVLFEEAGS